MKRFLFLAAVLVAPSVAWAQEYKPDFNCSVDHSKDSIATMLCQNSDAAKHELIFDQTYYALRQLVGQSGWKYLKQEAITDDAVLKQCVASIDPQNPQLLPPADPACYISQMDALTEKYRHRLSGSALEEAKRPINEHIALQARLIAMGYLPASATADGVYGEATRQAIQTWQRVSRRPQVDGFISEADANALLSGSGQSAPQEQESYSPVNPSGAGTAYNTQQSSAAQPSTKEDDLILIVDEGRQEYENGQNDFQKGAARPRRASKICSLIRSPQINNWVGTVEELSSNSSGYGVLKIRISPHATVGTSNNSFSDSLGEQRTLIAPSDPVFSQVSNLRDGQRVIFSGRFSTSQDDCLDETSVTQSGSMEDPDFEMRFTNVTPAD
ncbi:peptidoglycan-binding protein [Acetobacter sp. P5B1]|uniref:peptidoglycan-binding domain-containing protein n=1 Tax=Acetobacter sp. P5B1 TaxID=2762620 RepID=UPI00207B8A11|nr:peptidoglycan-binding domain-containing protein [Acetobacter sp. P5B1]